MNLVEDGDGKGITASTTRRKEEEKQKQKSTVGGVGGIFNSWRFMIRDRGGDAELLTWMGWTHLTLFSPALAPRLSFSMYLCSSWV